MKPASKCVKVEMQAMETTSEVVKVKSICNETFKEVCQSVPMPKHWKQQVKFKW